MPDDSNPASPPEADKSPSDQLQFLQKSLYTRRESPELKQRTENLAQLGVRTPQATPPLSPPLDDQRFADVMTEQSRRRRKILRVTAIGAAAVVLLFGVLALTWWYRISRQVTDKQVLLTFNGPTSITSGQEVEYTLTVGNDSRMQWDAVEVLFRPPPGFRLSKSQPTLSGGPREYHLAIGSVPAGDKREITVTGRLVGEQGAAALVQAELLLTPHNFPSGRFPKTAALTTIISQVPLDVAIESSSEAANGERVVATIQVRNTSASALTDIALHLKPTAGIRLSTEDSQFTPNFSVPQSFWLIDRLEPLESTTRTVVAYIEGRSGEKQTLEIEASLKEGDTFFPQRSIAHVISISTSELAIEHTYNNVTESLLTVAPDTVVTGKVRYHNSGTVGLKAAVLKVQLEGIAFDASSLKLSTGSYDPRTKTITWSSASVPELQLIQPQQKGEVEFNFKVRSSSQFALQGDGSRNNTITSRATIDSPDLKVPVGQERRVISSQVTLAVATDPTLAVDAFYDDGRLGINSSGPLPPTVGQTTTYTVRMRVGSTLNDVGDVEVTAILPDGVSYTDQVYKTTGIVVFNSQNGEVKWQIPLLAGGKGRSVPAEEIDFQVAITPGENKRRQVLPLLQRVTVAGTDHFTDTAVGTTASNLPTTETAVPHKGEVQ